MKMKALRPKNMGYTPWKIKIVGFQGGFNDFLCLSFQGEMIQAMK